MTEMCSYATGYFEGIVAYIIVLFFFVRNKVIPGTFESTTYIW
jgi:hypothetical protein